MLGKISKYSDRGFGFIQSTSDPVASDLFFHVSSLLFPENLVKKQLPVEFDLGLHRGNPVAKNIRILETEGAE